MNTEKIEELLQWFVTSSTTNKEWMSKRKEAQEENHAWIQPEVIRAMSDEELEKKFIQYYRSGGERQTIVQIYRDRIIRDKKRFRETLLYLLDQSIDLDERIEQILHGKYKIEGLGKAILTSFLMDYDPDNYCLWNNKTDMGLETLGWSVYENRDSEGERYQKVLEALNKLKDMKPELNLSFNDVDLFLHVISADKEGIEVRDSILSGPKVIDEEMIRIWWVNQGQTLKIGKEGGFLWAPFKDKRGSEPSDWRRLQDIKTGDIVLNYANGYLQYVSKALSVAEPAKKPQSFEGLPGSEDGRMVKVEYHTLKPQISLMKFNEKVGRLDIPNGPLDKTNGVKQGYLFNFSEEALREVQESQPETPWPDFAIITSFPDIRGLEELKSSFLNCFPQFNTFQDPGEQFLKAEDKWKRLALVRMHSLFDDWVSKEVSSLSPDNVAANIQTVLSSPIEGIGVPNLTNWRDNEYIKNNLFNTDGKKHEVARLIHNLLQKAKNDESIESPLEDLLSWLKNQDCAANISKIFPSILLFYWNPIKYIFIKPTIFDRFLIKIGGKPIGDGVYLTSSVYNQILQKMSSVRDALRDLGPRDMIDLQSFYYVAMENLRPGTKEVEINGEEGELLGKPPLPLNLILYGPPGTGKTYKIRHDYMPMFRGKDLNTGEVCNNYEFVTFHQSFSYEDFVEGIKPCVVEGGGKNNITYEVKDGIFKQLVSRACSNPNDYHAIFIDEINRANVSRVFGELITLIEEDKRLVWDPNETKWTGDMTVKLPYTHTQNPDQPLFGIPNNLYIIGTMNTADRSIALIDTALRRRFAFEEVVPDSKIISLEGNQTITKDDYTIDLVRLMDSINQRIEILYDRDHRIGHSYFLGIKTYEDLEKVFLNNIIPLLQEYFYADWEKIQVILADVTNDYDTDNRPKVKDTAIVTYQIADARTVPGAADWELQQKRVYNISKPIHPTSIIKIYET